MAAKWNLTCLMCLTALPLGRLVTVNDEGEPCEPYWEGFRNNWDKRWITGAELREAMFRFICIHVGHEMATVDTDTILDALEDFSVEDDPLHWIQDIETLDASATVVPEQAERTLRADLERRLRGSAL